MKSAGIVYQTEPESAALVYFVFTTRAKVFVSVLAVAGIGCVIGVVAAASDGDINGVITASGMGLLAAIMFGTAITIVIYYRLITARTPGPAIYANDTGLTLRRKTKGAYIPWAAVESVVVTHVNGIQNGLSIEIANRFACSTPSGAIGSLIQPSHKPNRPPRAGRSYIFVGRGELPCSTADIATAILRHHPYNRRSA